MRHSVALAMTDTVARTMTHTVTHAVTRTVTHTVTRTVSHTSAHSKAIRVHCWGNFTFTWHGAGRRAAVSTSLQTLFHTPP